jgi:hypothetical protein
MRRRSTRRRSSFARLDESQSGRLITAGWLAGSRGARVRMLATDRVCPHLIEMDVAKIILYELERAQAYAYPGRGAAEHNAVLRELWRLLQERARAARALARV